MKVVPDTPGPEKVPGFPEFVGPEPTGAGVAVNVLVSPAHILALDDVIFKLLFCLTLTVMEDEPAVDAPPG
jgi:hypothetical protein